MRLARGEALAAAWATAILAGSLSTSAVDVKDTMSSSSSAAATSSALGLFNNAKTALECHVCKVREDLLERTVADFAR